jgi:hemolysin III
MSEPKNSETDSGSLHLPLLEESVEYRRVEPKPSWRGVIHLATLPLAIAAGIVLVVLAKGVPATISSAVFAATSILLFGISGTYHRFNWSAQVKVLLKRLDHANIFLLIAGTYTPIAVLALESEKAWRLLSIVWIGTALGIAARVLWINAPRFVYVPLYLGLGWAAVMYMGDLLEANLAMMVLVIVGGLLYSLGAVVYAMKWPNPAPHTFGFHEIFHVFTVLAFISHWSAVLIIAINPPGIS